MASDTTAEPSDPYRVIAMYSYADWVVELLIDDLYRSCAPQASNRRTGRASNKVTEGAPNNGEDEKRGPNGKARVEKKSTKRKTLDGDGESEDEDSQKKKKKPNDAGKYEKRWACPFVKWDPEEYRCNISPTQIRGLVFSPYANKATSDFMDRAEVHFRSKRSQEILEEVGSKIGLKEAQGKQFVEMVRDNYLLRMFQEKAINGERFCELISQGLRDTMDAQSNQVDNAGTSKVFSGPDSQYHTSTPSPRETFISYQFPEPKLEDFPMFDPKAPVDETGLGDDAFNDLFNLAGLGDHVGGIEPRDWEGCSQEMFDSLLNFDGY
ncbi:hypothetical protein ACHAQC_003565 [Fusarium culmorum]